jgi:hypothetical protein
MDLSNGAFKAKSQNNGQRVKHKIRKINGQKFRFAILSHRIYEGYKHKDININTHLVEICCNDKKRTDMAQDMAQNRALVKAVVLATPLKGIVISTLLSEP